MLSITAPIAPSRTSTPALPAGPAPNQNGFIFIAASLTVRVLLAPRCQSAQTGCAQQTSTRYHSTFPAGLAETEHCNSPKQGHHAYIIIYRGALFGGCFTLFKDRDASPLSDPVPKQAAPGVLRDRHCCAG